MKKHIVLLTVLIITLSTAASGFLGLGSDQGKAAIVSLNGQIVPTSSPSALGGGGSLTPSNVRNLNSKAVENDADAIIYEWNSQGGSVVASKEIKREIESVNIPTVCRFRDVAASGAYLASLGCDKIIADSATLTGSIGVKSSYLEFSELLEEYGVEYVNVSSGKYKEVASPFENASSQDTEFLKNKTDEIHIEFISEVESERNLTKSEKEEVRTGEVFLGSKAQNLSLVDDLGGRKKALIHAENLTGKTLKPKEVEISPEFNIFSLLSSSTPLGQIIEQPSLLKAEWR